MLRLYTGKTFLIEKYRQVIFSLFFENSLYFNF